MKSCEFKTSEASTKSWFRTKGLIDQYLNILNLAEFRKNNTKFTEYAKSEYGVEGRLFLEEDNGTKAIPNTKVFREIDQVKAIRGNIKLQVVEQERDPQFFNNDYALFEQEENEYKESSVKIKEGVPELFESNPELANIGTPEQYSQYLDTIFPDSKVKDVVYHGTNKKNLILKEGFKKSKRINKFDGIYFTNNIKEAEEFARSFADKLIDSHETTNPLITTKLAQTNRKEYSRLVNEEFDAIRKENPAEIIEVILNAKNLDIINVKKESIEAENSYSQEVLDKLSNKLNSYNKDADSVIYKDYLDFRYISDVYSVKNPEQIHILGSKQDIEGFKSYIDNTEFGIDNTQFDQKNRNSEENFVLLQNSTETDILPETTDMLKFNKSCF